MCSFIIALFTILTDLLTEVQFQNHCMKKNLQDSQHTETLFDFISKMLNFVRARIQPLIFIGPLSVPIEENCTRNFKHFRTVQQLKCNGKGSSPFHAMKGGCSYHLGTCDTFSSIHNGIFLKKHYTKAGAFTKIFKK